MIGIRLSYSKPRKCILKPIHLEMLNSRIVYKPLSRDRLKRACPLVSSHQPFSPFVLSCGYGFDYSESKEVPVVDNTVSVQDFAIFVLDTSIQKTQETKLGIIKNSHRDYSLAVM